MARKKLQRIKGLDRFNNVIQEKDNNFKKRLDNFLKKYNHITLELACGKGEYSIALGEQNSNNGYIGIDIQGERLWRGANIAKEKKLKNIIFLRIQIEDLLKYFKKNSVNEIWIIFPDPFLKDKYIKKRLTSPKFLKIYSKIIPNKGSIHLKTDDKQLFNYSLKSIKDHDGKIIQKYKDIYVNIIKDSRLYIQTYYEKKHLEKKKKIYYLEFKIKRNS